MPEVELPDDLVRDLYLGPPDSFIDRRKALVGQLRSEGRREEAAVAGKLRRPTVAAWAVNQLAAGDDGRSALGELWDVGRRLEAVQSGSASGGAAALRQLAAERRDLVGQLVDIAADVLRAAGVDPSAHTEKVRATLESASLDADAAAVVEAGRLDKELDPPSGFGALGMMAPAEPEPETAEAEPPKRDDRELRRQLDRARAAAAAAHDKADAADLRVANLEQELESARESAARRRAAAEEADQALANLEELAELTD